MVVNVEGELRMETGVIDEEKQGEDMDGRMEVGQKRERTQRG